MFEKLMENVGRQEKGLAVLLELLQEEFSLLTGRDPKAVTGCEFSIQELLRQLAAERVALRAVVKATVPGARSLKDVLAARGEAGALLAEVMERVDALEQRCAVQAEKNSHLAMALADQSRNMLDFLHKQIQPKGNATYSQRGRVSSSHPEAALFRGRS
jgi:flagellar biosynthesis/type III secretory pathway chaperone